MGITSRLGIAAGTVAAIAIAAGPAVAQAPTPTTTTPAPTTPVAPLPPGIIGPSISIEGIDVSGLTRQQAEQRINAAVVVPKRQPLVVVIRGTRVAINPVAAGYRSFVSRAVQGALNVGRTQPPGPVDIPLTERVERGKLKRVLEYRARPRRVAPRDAVVSYSAGKVRIRRARTGIEVNIGRAMTRVESAILSGQRQPLTLPLSRVSAAVPRVPTTVFIDRGRFRLVVVRSAGVRTFPIAVGQSAYPTPSGSFRVVDKQRNPTWYPPDSRWAAGLGPVPPGDGNPLGTRWMGLSAPGIGIHGTPSSYSIGTRASHGCIRMYIRDAERLFEMVELGTPVTIV